MRLVHLKPGQAFCVTAIPNLRGVVVRHNPGGVLVELERVNAYYPDAPRKERTVLTDQTEVTVLTSTHQETV